LIAGQYNYETMSMQNGIFNIESKQLLWLNANYSFLQFQNGRLLDGTQNILKKIDILTGEIIWLSNLSPYASLAKILSVVNGALWLWMNDYSLIGINIENGEINKHFSPFEIIFEAGHFFFNYPYINEDSKVYFFERQYYIEIDLTEQKTNILWQQVGYKISASHIKDDFIYFIGSGPDTVYSNMLGVFDRNKLAIVWQANIELEKYVTLTANIQYHDNKLYVLDSGGTLHSFELT
jgi:hypothetical protein